MSKIQNVSAAGMFPCSNLMIAPAEAPAKKDKKQDKKPEPKVEVKKEEKKEEEVDALAGGIDIFGGDM